MRKQTSFNEKTKKANRDRDFTQITLSDDGRVVVEFNVWNAALKQQVATVVKLAPEEARLLAEMLKHNAGKSTLPAEILTTAKLG